MINVIYLRTSTEEQNPENQLKDCVGICDGEYTLVKEVQSAFKDNVNRDKFDFILKEIKGRRVKTLIVWDIDRLYRNRKKLIGFFKLCKMYGCNIKSYRQQWLNEISNMPSPFNEIFFDLFLNILGWIAEDESVKRSERVRKSLRVKNGVTYSRKGNRWGRKPVSTFKRNKIYNLRSQGLSIRQISKEVNSSVGAVHKVLKEYNRKTCSE